jgi:hypothetical protein
METAIVTLIIIGAIACIAVIALMVFTEPEDTGPFAALCVAIMLAAFFSVAVILAAHARDTKEISVDDYAQLKKFGEECPELQKEIVFYMEDDKITKDEFQKLENFKNIMKEKMELSSIKQSFKLEANYP